MKSPIIVTNARKYWISFKSLLTVALILGLFSSCSSVNSNSELSSSADNPAAVSEPLRILIDVEFASSYLDPHVNTGSASLLSNIKLSGGEIGDVEFEYLPKDGEERAAALTRMRTEVMTGEGPDLFICACSRPWKDEQALFQFPIQVMDKKLFLPLDDLIKKAKFTDFNRLYPLVMEQGRNEEGQQIVPLAFSIPITIFRKSEVRHEHSKTMTRMDMLSGDDYLVQSAVVPSGPCAFLSTGFKELANYQDETLCFSEESLHDYLMTYYEQSYNEEQPEIPTHFKSDLAVGFIETSKGEANSKDKDKNSDSEIGSDDELTMVPAYSAEGGYVAYITSFAAINRNTKKPEESFAFLDYLISSSGARSELYSYLTYYIGMPVNMDLGTRDMPISDILGSPWSLGRENYQEYCSLRDNASAARFSTPLENNIVDAYLDVDRSYYKKSQGESAEEPEKIISDAYCVMKMELAES